MSDVRANIEHGSGQGPALGAGFRPSLILLRYHLIGYLTRVVVTFSCLAALALGVDFADFWKQVADIAEGEGSNLVLAMGYYVLIRLPDIAAHMMGMGVFLGVLWWEIIQSRTGQRVASWNSGDSPARSLSAALVLGLLLAPVQFGLDAWLRPMVTEIQMDSGLGKSGQRFDRRSTDKLRWAISEAGIVSARFDFASRMLVDLTLYRLSNDGRLRHVVKADSATHIPQSGLWRLKGAKWYLSSSSPDYSGLPAIAGNDRTGSGSTLDRERGDSEVIELDLDPILQKFVYVDAVFLSPATMYGLLEHGAPQFLLDDYQTRLHHTYSRVFYPLLMAALAASAAVFAVGKMVGALVYLSIVSLGYLAHVFMKASVALGELGFAPPALSGWLGVSILALVLVLMQLRLALYTVGR